MGVGTPRFISVLVIAGTLILAACGDGDKKSPTATNALTPAATTQTPIAQGTSIGGQTPTIASSTPPPNSIAQPIARGDFELTMHGVTDPYLPSDDVYAAEEGYRWVLIEVSLKNTSQEELDYGADFSYVVDTEDFEYSSSSAAQAEEFDIGTIAPGETVRGQLSFDVPVEVQITQLIFDPDLDPATTIEIDLP